MNQATNFDTISVIGLGYIGLPTASLLASHGKRVKGVDVNPHIVSKVNAGESHFIEPELNALIRNAVSCGLLCASMEITSADVFIIAVPTPLREGHKPDVTYIKEVAQALAPVLARGNLIILESTSPVGTTEKLAQWLADARPDLTFPQQAGSNADVHLAFCPERVLPGKILHELAANDRVIGGMSVRASDLAEALYRIFVIGDIIRTDPRTAELCKLAENSFRDVNIAFANELSMLCDKMGIDVWKVRALANRHPRVNILEPGSGVGGHCIAVDPWFIVDSDPEQARLIRMARTVNDHKPRWLLEKIQSAVKAVCTACPGKAMADVTVACLGLAFKPDTDDLRESSAVKLVHDIASLGCQVLVVEPYLDALPPSLAVNNVRFKSYEEAIYESDVVAVLVRHSSFLQNIEKLYQHGKVVDAVGLL